MGFFSGLNEAVRSTSIDWKPVLAYFSVGTALFDIVLDVVEYGVQCRKEPPKGVAEQLKVEFPEFKKSQDYQKAKLRTSMVGDVTTLALNLYLLKTNAFAKLWYFVQPLVSRYLSPRWFGEGAVSIISILLLSGVSIIWSQPLSLYNTFVVEEKFGFNKQTIGLYFKDLVKESLIGAIFMPIFFGIIQKIIEFTGNNFVIYILGFVVVLNVVAMFVYPAIIMPWFNKFEPLEEGELRTRIEELAASQNFPLGRLYVSDGSTRSAHSNAYFIGLPWYKQIVLFDTLIKEQTTDEVVAVLAHELGHWKHTHLPILMASGLVQLAFTFAPLALFLGNKHFFQSLGFANETPILVAVMLFGDVLGPLAIALKFVTNFVTRACEYDADNFAVKLGKGEDLSKSLAKLSKSNLSALDENSLYSTYHNTHPRVTERLTAIKDSMKKIE